MTTISGTGSPELPRSTYLPLLGGALFTALFRRPILGVAAGSILTALLDKEGFAAGAKRLINDVVGQDVSSIIGPILGTTPAEAAAAAKAKPAEPAAKPAATGTAPDPTAPQPGLNLGTIAKWTGLAVAGVAAVNFIQDNLLNTCFGVPRFNYMNAFMGPRMDPYMLAQYAYYSQ